ncbi:MAG: hypothetical protein INR71_12640 [Terriglobus roseus]|nr:hypothetical protein [Terriglobus roseus]
MSAETDGRRAREAAKQQNRPDERDVNDALLKIEQNLSISEPASFALADAKKEYQKASQKRLLEVESAETSRRKVRPTCSFPFTLRY